MTTLDHGGAAQGVAPCAAPPALVLRAVGVSRAVGVEAVVYDLGGNVAEWVEGKDGTGILRGGSADRPADTKEASSRATPAYRGFRIFVDAAAASLHHEERVKSAGKASSRE